MYFRIMLSLGFISLLSSSAQETPETTTPSFLNSNPETQSQTTTSQPIDTQIAEHYNNILQLNPIERSSHVHHHAHVDPTFKGFWTKKVAWRPRWVKTWQEKKIYVAVWKRMWGPVVVKEWVPVPKPPPGWVKHDAHAPSYVVKKFHGK